jgi:hypothetical protein
LIEGNLLKKNCPNTNQFLNPNQFGSNQPQITNQNAIQRILIKKYLLL